MPDDTNQTTQPAQTEPLIATKPEAAKSEMWMVLIAALGSLATAATATNESLAKWVGFAVTIVTVGIYAYFRTPIAADSAGWKSKAFLGSAAVILLSITTAITDTEIPGLPKGVTQIAALITTALVALGYTAVRYKIKTSTAAPKLGLKPEK